VEKRADPGVELGGHRGRRSIRVELLDFTLTERTTMTEEGLPLNELLQKAGDGNLLRAVAESVRQLLMEADVEGLIGAGRHERPPIG
jgi:putative transposase